MDRSALSHVYSLSRTRVTSFKLVFLRETTHYTVVYEVFHGKVKETVFYRIKTNPGGSQSPRGNCTAYMYVCRRRHRKQRTTRCAAHRESGVRQIHGYRKEHLLRRRTRGEQPYLQARKAWTSSRGLRRVRSTERVYRGCLARALK